MEILCADCGCLVDRGLRLSLCDDVGCCCAALALQSTATLAARVVAALEASDLPGLGALLAPNARWGAPDDDVPACQNREQVIDWYASSREAGMSATVVASEVVGDNIVLGLRVSSHSVDEPFDDFEHWQVLSVRDGLVAEIRGYDERVEAEASAALNHSNWTP